MLQQPITLRRLALLGAPIALALTLLFSAQDALRGAMAGYPVDPWKIVRLNGLDWVTWSLFLPLIVVVGRGHRLDDARHRLRNPVTWLVLGVVCCAAVATITGPIVRTFHLLALPPQALANPLPRFLLGWMISTASLNILAFAMITGLVHALFYYDDMRDREQRAAKAELAVLRMQLQPHFFFNALHTVSSLMMTDVSSAQQMIASLGELVRASIDHTAEQEVPLRAELGFVQRYVDIQKARFRSRLQVELSVDDAALDAMVPSLVLQPLVENAIRHGVEQSASGGVVTIQGAVEGERVRLEVRNSVVVPSAVEGFAFHVVPAGATHSALDSGLRPPLGMTTKIGLANLEARMNKLYGDAYTFSAGRDSDGTFSVLLEVPLRRV